MAKRFLHALLHVFVPTLIVALSFLLPLFHFSFDAATILTVISILFTILVGFFIATATSNYLKLQDLITSANASMISLYNLVSLLNPASKQEVADAIDAYMIETLDHDLLRFAAETERDLDRVIRAIDEVRPADPVTASLLQNLHSEKTGLFALHQEALVSAKTIVSPRHWFILISLATLMGVLILALRDGSLLSAVITALLLYATYQALILLHEVDSNAFLAQKLAFQTPQQVFRAIGKLPYYPDYAQHQRHVRLPSRYRVGVSGSGGRTIRIVG